MRANKEIYIKVKIDNKTGKITTEKSDINSFNSYGGDLFSHYNGNTGKSYLFFVTSNKKLHRDCKKHFGRMLKEIDAEQKVLDRKRNDIEKMIKNSKEL